MTRRVAGLLVLLAAAVAALAASAAAGSGQPELVQSTSRFPEKRLSLTLPERQRLTADNVGVTENGEPVSDLVVAPPGADTSTMLLIDASLTMRGDPITDAMAAARAFAEQRNPSQKLSVATFNDEVTLLLPFTSDPLRIDQALQRTPDTAYGTVIYDAVDYAIDQIQDSGSTTGTIVLLADGQNVGSDLSLEDAIRRLRDTGIRLFAVGLQSPAYYAPPLERLSARSGGTYSEASDSSGLTQIYDALGFRLANEYLLMYRSLAAADAKVRVAVQIPGYRPLRTTYTAPALALSSPTIDRSLTDEVLQSTPFMVFLVCVIVGLLLLAARLIFDLRRRSLRSRMAGFVEMGEEGKLLNRDDLAAKFERFEQSLERRSWIEKFAERCDLAGIRRAPGWLMIIALAISFGIAVVLSVAWTSWALLLAPLGPVIVYWYVNRRVRRQQQLFDEQLSDNLDVLAQSLRVGHSLVGGLSHMADDAAEPSRSEFRRVVTDEQLGIPLEDAMRKVAARMDSPDMEHVALVALLQRETGGASAEVIDRVAENIRGRMETRRLIRVLTAQGRLARWIVSLMPLVLLLIILAVYPDYLDPLLHETLGIITLVFCGILVVIGSLVIKRIVEIKV